MMNIVTTVLSFLLGKKDELGGVNRATGVINYAWALPALGWVWFHRTETLVLQVVVDQAGKHDIITLLSTTYLGASLVVGAVFLYVEFNRRAT